MIPYYILVGIPLILGSFRYKGQKIENRNRDNLYLFFAILTLLLVLRSESVGRDLKNYHILYSSYSRMTWQRILEQPGEILFIIYNKLLGACGASYQMYLAITAILTMIPIAHVYGKTSEDALFSIVLFINMSTFLMLFSGIRQAIVIGLGMIAYEYVKSKRLFPFLLLVFFGYFIHNSAFMLLFMYPAYHLRLKKKWLLVIIPALILLYINNQVVFRILTFFIPSRYDTSTSNTGGYTMIILFALFLAFSYYIPDEKLLDEEVMGLRNFLVVAVALQMFAPLHSLAMRMNYYYIIFIPLLLPKIVKRSAIFKRPIANIGRYIMILFFLVYFFCKIPIEDALDIFPYQFFWENKI